MARRLRLGISLGLVVLAMAAASTPPLGAGTAHLVADLEPTPSPFVLAPGEFLTAGARVVYVGDDVESQPALWASDGTAAGTQLIANPCPLCGYLEPMGSTGALAFFSASQYVSSLGGDVLRVIRTDGTSAGTFEVTPVLRTQNVYPPVEPVVAGRYIYFFTGGEEVDFRLWRSDGGPAVPLNDTSGVTGLSGSRLVALGEDVYFLAGHGFRYGLFHVSSARDTIEIVREISSRLAPSQLVAIGSRLFFFAAASGRELWSSDGTAGGTTAITSFAPREPMPADGLLVDVGGRAWFAANDGSHGEQLWVSDGTGRGTHRASAVTESAPSSGGRFAAARLAAVDGRVVFAVADKSASERLWSTTGDWQSSAPLAGCADGCPHPSQGAFAELGNRLVFGAVDADGGVDPWITDGTGGGTRRLRDTAALHLRAFTASGGAVYFEDLQGVGLLGSLWATDGTAGGTVRLGPGRFGEGSYCPLPDSAPYPLGSAGGRTFFGSSDATGGSGELWATSGPATGAARVADPPIRGLSTYARILGAVDERALAIGCRGNESRIWSLGAEGATEVIGSDELGSCGASATSLVATGDGALFMAYANLGGVLIPELWTTDGSVAGTRRLPLPGAASQLAPVAYRGGALLTMTFVASGTTSFWTSDGTAGGTREIVELPTAFGELGAPVVAGDLFYFTAYDEEGYRLWRSDGSSSGTFPLMAESPGYIDPATLVALGDRLYFLAPIGGSYEVALWSTDGTVDGTRQELREAGLESVDGLQQVAGRLWFRAIGADDPSRRTLWVSDGTAAGTRRLPVEVPDDVFAATFTPPQVVAVGNVAYFRGGDDVHGLELWRSDGTVAGTTLVVDLFPGGTGSRPLALTALGGRLHFSATAPNSGTELWSTDGTASGTRLETDVSPGSSWGWPQDLHAAGSLLFFTAADGPHGREPWVFDPAAPATP